MASADLSSILSASKDLTKHLPKPSDLPSVNLSLEQIEAQSRRLVSKQNPPGDVDRANYLLAQASVDGSALSQSIAHLNASTTFASSTLQPLQDTDVSAFLRHAHEQNIISTIENGRKETQESFYRMLEDRTAKEWEAKKRRLFEQLGASVPVLSTSTLTTSALGKSTSTTKKQLSVPGPLSLQMHTKMLSYDRAVVALNDARLRGTAFPIIHALMDAANDSAQTAFMFTVLAKITQEPPALPPLEHASAHILNSPVFERKYAKAYLPSSTPALSLRKQIVTGARQALEEQYLSIIQRTVHSHPSEAQLGGDPSTANLVRAFCAVRFYRQGEWLSGLELVKGTPLWAQVFFLVRVGEVSDALQVIHRFRDAVDAREPGFVEAFRIWAESAERSLPPPIRDQLTGSYNSHMLQAQTTDPFKLALYKLIARLDVQRRSIPNVTTTTEDWLWMQFAMVEESATGDENEESSLAALTKVLLAYGERHFEPATGSGGQRSGLWASVLLMCGQFERAVASLWDRADSGSGGLQVEAVHLAVALAYHGLLRVSSRAESSDVNILTLSPSSTGGQPVPSLALHTFVWRYVRQFVKMDAKEALQYVYTLPLSSDQPSPPGVGHEQLEATWELVRRIIVMANGGPMWEELVGGVKGDGTRFPGVIPTYLRLLRLSPSSDSLPSSQSQSLSLSTGPSLQTSDYKSQILLPTASSLLSNDRLPEAIKLYDLAGEYDTVVGCLAQALGNLVASGNTTLGLGGGGGVTWSTSGEQANRAKELEKTAREILAVYERLGRGTGLGAPGFSSSANAGGKDRDACVKLLKILEAGERGREGQVDRTLEILESTSLVPIDVGVANGKDGEVDVIKVTRKAEGFAQLHEALQRCLPIYLVMCMDALSGVAAKIKSGAGAHGEAQKLATLAILRKKSRALMVYAGLLKYRMSPEVYGYLARGDVEVAL